MTWVGRCWKRKPPKFKGRSKVGWGAEGADGLVWSFCGMIYFLLLFVLLYCPQRDSGFLYPRVGGKGSPRSRIMPLDVQWITHQTSTRTSNSSLSQHQFSAGPTSPSSWTAHPESPGPTSSPRRGSFWLLTVLHEAVMCSQRCPLSSSQAFVIVYLGLYSIYRIFTGTHLVWNNIDVKGTWVDFLIVKSPVLLSLCLLGLRLIYKRIRKCMCMCLRTCMHACMHMCSYNLL